MFKLKSKDIHKYYNSKFSSRNKLIKYAFIPVFTLLSVLFYSCSDTPTSTGSDLLQEDFIGVNEINSLTDSIAQTSSDYKNVLSLSAAENLYLGKSGNVEGNILIDFYFGVIDSILQAARADSVTIISATVSLIPTYYFGDSTTEFTAHRITGVWSTGYTADSSVSYDETNIIQSSSYTDSIVTFTLNNDIVLGWLKEGDSSTVDLNDYGLYLKPADNSAGLIGFQAISSVVGTSEWPSLSLIYRETGFEEDTLTLVPEKDLSIVKGDRPTNISQENIVVQAGLSYNSKLWFDISSIPQNSVINYAELTLTVDTLETKTGSGFTNSLTAYQVLDPNDLDSISTGSAGTLSRSGSQFTGDVTSIINGIYSAQANDGIILRAGGRFSGVELFVLKGSNAPEDVRPQLKIIYTNKQ